MQSFSLAQKRSVCLLRKYTSCFYRYLIPVCTTPVSCKAFTMHPLSSCTSLVTRSLSSCEVYSSSSYSVMAMAASPAVSVRKVVFPKETDLPPASTICWASFSEKPPSGPMMMAMFSSLASFPALSAAVLASASDPPASGINLYRKN